MASAMTFVARAPQLQISVCVALACSSIHQNCLVLVQPKVTFALTMVRAGWIALWCVLATRATAVNTPLYGWCKGSHRPKKPAQSGYERKSVRYNLRNCTKRSLT